MEAKELAQAYMHFLHDRFFLAGLEDHAELMYLNKHVRSAVV